MACRIMKNFYHPQERRRTTRWATPVDPNYAPSFGCKEGAHNEAAL